MAASRERCWETGKDASDASVKGGGDFFKLNRPSSGSGVFGHGMARPVLRVAAFEMRHVGDPLRLRPLLPDDGLARGLGDGLAGHDLAPLAGLLDPPDPDKTSEYFESQVGA